MTPECLQLTVLQPLWRLMVQKPGRSQVQCCGAINTVNSIAWHLDLFQIHFYEYDQKNRNSNKEYSKSQQYNITIINPWFEECPGRF